MRDDDSTPTAEDGPDELAAFRSDPSSSKRFGELRERLKKAERGAELAEVLELRAGYERDDARAAGHLAEAAEEWIGLGDGKRAEADFRLALQRDPAQARAASHYADYLIDSGRYAEAAAVIEAEVRALEERAGNGGGDVLSRRRAARHAALAALWERYLGRLDRALHNWQRAWQLDPSRTEALESARGIYSSLGDDRMVVRLYEAELGVLPDDAPGARRAELRFAIGRLQAKMGQVTEAGSSFEDTLRLDPSIAEAREALADLYASPAFTEDRAAQERAASLFVDLGQERLRRGAIDDAVRYLRRALGVDPFSRSAANDLEKALREGERWTELDRLYRHLATTVSTEKERSKLLYRRAVLARDQLGDREAYKQALAEAAALGTEGGEARDALRAIYREDENWEPLAALLAADVARMTPGSDEFVRLTLELATIEREYLRQRDRAAEHIHSILQHDPRQEEALARYADHFRERRDWRGLADLGEFALEKLREGNGSPGEVVRRLEELALLYEQRLGDIDKAIDAWGRIAQVEPENPKATEAMRRLASRAKTWQSYISVLENEAQAARTPEERVEALKRIAQTYRERHFNPRRAIQLFEEVLGLVPDDASALKSLAELYDREGDEAGLAHTLRRQLELDARLLDREAMSVSGRAPTTREWPVSKRVERLNLLRRLASMYEERLADVDGVVFACSGILEILPGDRDALARMERVLDKAGDVPRLEQTLQYHAACANGPAERSKVLRRLARIAADRDDEIAAMERWEQVLGAAPSDRDALDALADLYERHKRWGELAGVLERRVLAPRAEEPGSPEAAERAAELRRYARVVDEELGDRERAVKAWRRLAELLPRDRQALESLAKLYEDSNQWRDLAPVLASLAELYKDGESSKAASVALKRAALLEERLGAPADAAAALEELLRDIDPSNLAGHKALRRLYEARGDFDSAVRIAEREIFLADEPKQKIARGLEIGFLCRDRLGDSTRALQAFERVLELDPDHGEALEAAADLYAAVGAWTDHVRLLEKQLERVKSVRERRSVMLRVAQVVAERLGDHKGAFDWYRRAHAEAPDPGTLAELRRAAEAYGLWRELIEIYDAERDNLRSGEMIADKAAFVDMCREIATVCERRLRDPQRAIGAIREALSVMPRSEALVAEAERIARDADKPDIWKAYLECLEKPMAAMERPGRVAGMMHRARVFEERLDDRAAAMNELVAAFALQPERDDLWQAIYQLGDRMGSWDQVLAVESARFERAPTRERRVACLRQKADIVESRVGDAVRAFRIHLSAFLLAPEDSETLASLWRLARDIGTYKDKDKVPGDEPPPAFVEPPEAVRRRPARPSMPPPRKDPTMELSVADLVAAQALARGAEAAKVARVEIDVGDDLDSDTVDTAETDAPTIEPDTDDGRTEVEAQIPAPERGDQTQPLDIRDLLDEGPRKPAADPTMQLRTEDLIQALGARRTAVPPPAPPPRRKRPSQAPPPPPPGTPLIRREVATQAAPQPVATKVPAVVPRMPKRSYDSPWEELSSAYELLPTPSPAMKLRWLFRSAEVQETGAGNIERAFDILAKALGSADDTAEARARLHRLAEAHDAWERLAQLYLDAADGASSVDVAAAYLLEVADIRIQQGRPLETESIYRRILGMRPDDDASRSKLEGLYRRENRWIDLAASLEERTDPRLGSAAPEAERPNLLRELAEVYEHKLSRPHDAIDALERLRKLVPEDVAVLESLAELHAGLGRWSKVIDSLSRIAEIDETSPEAREALRRVAGIYETKLELHDRAIDVYSQMVRQWPDDGDAYAALDRLYESHGRWQDLSGVLRRRAALARDAEERAELLSRRARVLLDWLDAPDEAAAALRHARTIRTDDDAIADALVTALVRAGREREAAAVLEGRIESMRGHDDGNLGNLAALLIRLAQLRHESMADREGARLALEEALTIVPDHPTALAAQSRLARDERDPRAYAEALRREAEVTSDNDAKVAALMEAGEVLRDRCGDGDAARGAFEEVLVLQPHHAGATWALAALATAGGDIDSAAGLLTQRLETDELSAKERAEILTQLAALARQADARAMAELRIDEALGADPGHVPAIVAKADLLYEVEQWDALESFLLDVLEAGGEMTRDIDPATAASLRRRLALVFEHNGRSDEAYQALLEADRVHRGDVLIKLALGENRYRARRWREAALHLSALADHPDAERYPAEVAEGLYHAALAEIRSLRPEKAGPLYERAISLKPNYAPALHALAELAMEQGDSKRAADLLTRQANATSDPAEKLRMFEALGDMAMMTLRDEDRARVCYQAAVNAASPLEVEHVPLLKKLLELQDLGADHNGAGRTAELLASFADTREERAARLTLAAESYRSAGDARRARETAERAIAIAPHDLLAASILSELMIEGEEYEAVASLLARTLGGKNAQRSEVTAPREALLWDRLGSARLQRKDRKGATAAFERSIALAPDSDGAMSARRHLLELWQETDETKSRLIEYHRTLAGDTRDIADLVGYARALSSVQQYDGGRALLELAKQLGHELSEEDLVFLRGQPVRVMAADEAYDGVIGDELHSRLIGEPDFVLMSSILATLWESASLLFSDTRAALASYGLQDARRVTAGSSAPAAAIFTRIANALRASAVLLYQTDDPEAPDVSVVCASPPIVVLGPRLSAVGAEAIPDGDLRFILGRAVELSRPENIIAAGLPFERFAELVESLRGAFGDGPETEAARNLRTTLPVRTRQPLTALVGRALGADLDPRSYLDAAHRKADRMGYLVSGDAEASVRRTALRAIPEGVRHLVELALTPEFCAARTLLGVGVLR